MAVISNWVKDRIQATEVEIFFVPRAAAKWWNAQRTNRKEIIALLCGWYWSYRGQEAGPFKTISAAQRDFYYRQITRQRPPLMDGKDLEQSKREHANAHGTMRKGHAQHARA